MARAITTPISGGTDLYLYKESASSDLVMVQPGELMTDLYGLSTVTTVWKAPADYNWRGDARMAMFAAHPTYGFANIERRRVSTDGGVLTVVADYAGVDGQTAHIYELCVGVQDEPIVSHPLFVSAIGGKPSEPKHGAVFLGPDGNITTDDSIGQFAYFNIGSDFAGIESYLAADFVTVRERYSFAGSFSAGRVGHLSSPPDTVGYTATNWILLSVNCERRANCFIVTNEWRAGGRKGWNTTIYS